MHSTRRNPAFIQDLTLRLPAEAQVGAGYHGSEMQRAEDRNSSDRENALDRKGVIFRGRHAQGLLRTIM